MISKKNERVILKFNEKDFCSISDFVPKIFKYHSSFYKSYETELNYYITREKDILTNKNVFSLNKNGHVILKMLNNLKGEKVHG